MESFNCVRSCSLAIALVLNISIYAFHIVYQTYQYITQYQSRLCETFCLRFENITPLELQCFTEKENACIHYKHSVLGIEPENYNFFLLYFFNMYQIIYLGICCFRVFDFSLF